LIDPAPRSDGGLSGTDSSERSSIDAEARFLSIAPAIESAMTAVRIPSPAQDPRDLDATTEPRRLPSTVRVRSNLMMIPGVGPGLRDDLRSRFATAARGALMTSGERSLHRARER